MQAHKGDHTRVVMERLRTVSSLQSTIRDFNTRVSALRSQLLAHVRGLGSSPGGWGKVERRRELGEGVCA